MLFNKDVLSKVLTLLNRASTAKGLPIYDFVLFKCKKGETAVSMTCADGNVVLSTTINANDPSDADSNFCVPARLLLDIIKQLPQGDVSLSLQNGGLNLEVNWGSGKSSLFTADWKDFPDTPAINSDAIPFSINQAEMVRCLNNVTGATADDSYGRPALASVNFDCENGILNIVASDSHQLICASCDTNMKDGSFLLPESTALLLARTVPADNEKTATVISDDNHVRFTTDEFVLTSKLVCGKFPKYRTIIPDKTEGTTVIEKDLLLKTVKRMNVFSDRETATLDFFFSEGKILIKAENLILGMCAEDTISCDYAGDSIELRLKVPYLVNILNSIKSNLLEIGVSVNSRPLRIQPSQEQRDKEKTVAILMPHITKKR